MATLKAIFSMSSTALVDGVLKLDTSSEVSTSFSDTSSDTATITHGAAIELITTGVGVDKYIYIKNTDPTNYVKTQTSAGTNYGNIHPGEFAFFCVREGEGLKVQANLADCIIDYIMFSKS